MFSSNHIKTNDFVQLQIVKIYLTVIWLYVPVIFKQTLNGKYFIKVFLIQYTEIS